MPEMAPIGEKITRKIAKSLFGVAEQSRACDPEHTCISAQDSFWESRFWQLLRGDEEFYVLLMASSFSLT